MSVSTTSTADIVYHQLAPLYDAMYGVLLQPGRRSAMTRLAPQAGESILEVGVGTGFGLRAYRSGCRVAAIDLSQDMLARAARRRQKHGLAQVTLCRMDATRLAFADGVFDAVYAPYVVNVVPDPVGVGREMLRVCRPGGRLVLLNHFDDVSGSDAATRMAGRVASWLTGVNWHIELEPFLAQTGWCADSIEPTNLAGVSSVVLCRKR